MVVMGFTFFTLLLVLAAPFGSVQAVEVAKLRRLMVDTRFVGLVSPCTTGGSQRNTAAEWLRTAFHDAASHDHAAGTGGIDASIVYETGYSENGGAAFTTTLNQFRTLRPEGVSMADMIVLGAITAVEACGGPVIPFNPGRVDASRAVGEGFVPLPEQSTESHTQAFARMGFSREEMIELIAAGHTIGQVHASVNPRIVASGIKAFDDTRTTYDNHVALDYVNDIRTNPLAQVYDPAFPERSSDSRIFASDGNVTIRALANSQSEYMSRTGRVLLKMFNEAIPAGNSLSPAITPFPVSMTFRTSLRNGAFLLQTGSARVYDMVGQWSSFEIGYTNRDGSLGSDTNLIFPRTMRTLSIGKTIQIRDFSTRSPGVPASTGIGSVFVSLRLNDGSIYTSTEGEERVMIDDTVTVDIGDGFSCTYSGAGNSNTLGLNITMAVLGPYDKGDKVEIVYRTADGAKGYLEADYRRSRDDYYNYYGLFIPDYTKYGLTTFGARVTKASGKVSTDDRNGIYYYPSDLDTCIAGAEIPTPGPRPSGGTTNPSRRNKQRALSCGTRKIYCDGFCIDPLMDLEHCGGCSNGSAGAEGDGGEDPIRGVDCTALSDGDVACVEGVCVVTENEDIF